MGRAEGKGYGRSSRRTGLRKLRRQRDLRIEGLEERRLARPDQRGSSDGARGETGEEVAHALTISR